jgi:hypothetical protein
MGQSLSRADEHDSLSLDERHLGNRKGKPVSPLQGLMVLHPESQGSAALHPGLCYFALPGLSDYGAAHFTPDYEVKVHCFAPNQLN